jgi:hypothetical protein
MGCSDPDLDEGVRRECDYGSLKNFRGNGTEVRLAKTRGEGG